MCDRYRDEDQGQATFLMVVAVALVAVVGFGLARIGVATVDRAHAQSAADASALAGAAEGRAAAAEVAADNGASLVAYGVDGTDVLVSVRIGDETASARARADRGRARVP